MEDDRFYFESDHVALKNNPDYQKLLRTVAILEAQRSRAVKDLDILIQRQSEALHDPISFVANLQNQSAPHLPGRQTVEELPLIDWDSYGQTDAALLSTFQPRHATRFQASIAQNGSISKDVDVVRGKIRVGKKADTFNSLWTIEEQQKLEMLLVKYPSEEVEARRWEKIAMELGNRTKYQVWSRVQKYFVRLAKEGLPVPGRRPHNRALRQKPKNLRLLPNSTMCASFRPPVYMSEDDSDSESTGRSSVQVSDDEDIPQELRNTLEYQELMRLKAEKKLLQGLYKHLGYKCDRCGSEPIEGTRWHCTDCPDEASVDFCDDCADFVYEKGCHRQSHKLDAVRIEQDRDYQHTNFGIGDYNYLDPNYLPAT